MTHCNVHNRMYTPGSSLGKEVRQLIIGKLELGGGDQTTSAVPYGLMSLVARSFSVTEAFVCKIWKLYCTSNSLSPKMRGPMKGFAYKISDEDQEYKKMLVTSNPTIY